MVVEQDGDTTGVRRYQAERINEILIGEPSIQALWMEVNIGFCKLIGFMNGHTKKYSEMRE